MAEVSFTSSSARATTDLHGEDGGSVCLKVGALLVPSSVALVTTSKALVPSSFLFLVVGPGAPSSVLAPSSDALCY